MTSTDSHTLCQGHVVVVCWFLTEALCLAWKIGNMLCPAVRGIISVCISIAFWKLISCVGTRLHNPSNPFKPVPVSGWTSCFPWSREPCSCDCMALCRHWAALQGAAPLLIFLWLWVRAGKSMGLASGLSQGQPEGLSLPQQGVEQSPASSRPRCFLHSIGVGRRRSSRSGIPPLLCGFLRSHTCSVSLP